MTGRDTLLLAAGTTALAGSVLATTVMWVLVTNPVAIVNEAMAQELGGGLHVAAAVLHDMIFHLAKYL
jgi:hypothetical protein